MPNNELYFLLHIYDYFFVDFFRGLVQDTKFRFSLSMNAFVTTLEQRNLIIIYGTQYVKRIIQLHFLILQVYNFYHDLRYKKN